jgi:hypothetical protein
MRLVGGNTNDSPRYLIARVGQMVFAYDGEKLIIATPSQLDDPAKKGKTRANGREANALPEVQARRHAAARELVRRVRANEPKPLEEGRARPRRKDTRRRVGQGDVVLHQPKVS